LDPLPKLFEEINTKKPSKHIVFYLRFLLINPERLDRFFIWQQHAAHAIRFTNSMKINYKVKYKKVLPYC